MLRKAGWHSGAVGYYNGAPEKWGITMRRYRLALIAIGILLLTAPSAWAFSQQNVASVGDGSSSFTDPDDQLMNNFGVRLSEQPMQSVSSSKVHSIPFGGTNRYTATALIIRRFRAASERASFYASNLPPPRA